MSEQSSKERTVQTMDEAQSQKISQTVELKTDVHEASDEEVRRASKKVFRLHARLFEELAK